MNRYDVRSEFQGRYTTDRASTRYLAVHHAAAVYPGARGIDHVRSAATYHVESRGWPGIAYHVCLAEETRGGPIARYDTSDLETRRFHVGDMNTHTLGVCCLTDFGNRIPEAKWIEALAEVLRELGERYPDAEIVGHQEIVADRSCPGERWPEWKPTLLERVGDGAPAADPRNGAAEPRVLGEPVQPNEPNEPAGNSEAAPAVGTISPLLVVPRSTAERCSRYMLSRPTGEYTEYDVRAVIVPAYFEICGRAGLNPLLAISQMIHETGNLTSWWSQRPRRNPAGLGVTGEVRREDPGDPDRWVFHAERGEHRAGLSFPSWDEHAIPAHVGRLLAYAAPSTAALTGAQRELIDTALRARPLPDRLRGTAPTLEGLAGSWAVPGLQTGGGREISYAESIATIASRIVGGG